MLTTQARPQDGGTLVDLAVGAGNFTTLVAAVEAAGLVDALSGEGPLTVFAPTDAAFAALGEDTLKELLTERGRPQLTRILLHHVVA
ncbi:MAG: fasciclin domain-containing protein, partial [Planctomycetota bacterium]|nr:fasciclin domain-containing protein [Planctomycetota bacterium]